MKTKNIKQVGIFLVIMVMSVSSIFAQNNAKGQGMQGPMFVNIIPNLTADQTAKIEALQLDMQKKVMPMQADLDIKRAENKALMASDATMKEKEAKIKEMSDIQLNIHLARAQFHNDVRELLDDEQKVAFDKWTLNHDHHQGQGNHRKGKGNGQGYGKGQGNGKCNGQGPQNRNR